MLKQAQKVIIDLRLEIDHYDDQIIVTILRSLL